MTRGGAYKQVMRENESAFVSRHRNSAQDRCRCDGCGRKGGKVRRAFRVDENLRQVFERRCEPCRRDGWFEESA
mgnify:CR=1 FL=1